MREKEKLGVIVLGDNFGKNVAVILENGEDIKFYEFTPQTIESNIDEYDEQGRSHPARLENELVKFFLDENDNVTEVIFLGYLAEPRGAQKMCFECAYEVFTMAANECDCGYTKNSAFKFCDVCAIKNNRCAACGTSLEEPTSSQIGL